MLTLHHGTQPSTTVFNTTNKCGIQIKMKLLHFCRFHFNEMSTGAALEIAAVCLDSNDIFAYLQLIEVLFVFYHVSSRIYHFITRISAGRH